MWHSVLDRVSNEHAALAWSVLLVIRSVDRTPRQPTCSGFMSQVGCSQVPDCASPLRLLAQSAAS